MPTYKTPDVYIEEISVFPPSVAEVETAIPAFIGYTQKAIRNAPKDLNLKPTKIYSLKEYETHYGYPKEDPLTITVVNDGSSGLKVDPPFTEPTLNYLMYYSIKMFFDNGGGQCYIISVGNYPSDTTTKPQSSELTKGLNELRLEDEPTLIIIPEAVKLSTVEYRDLVQAVLKQCNDLCDRFAIFDLYNGDKNLDETAVGASSNYLVSNRDYFGSNYLKYGAVYYPFLKTTLNFYVNDDETNVTVTPPAGSGATATSTISVTGAITGIAVTSGGIGYTSAPTVVISGGGGTGAIATATVSPTGVITSIAVTSGGTGYTSSPTISFTGGGGSVATANVSPAGVITGIAVTSGGTGYTSAPTVVISGGGGTGATATATVSPAGVITGITVTSGGTGYTSTPTISFTGGGGSVATANVSPAGVITGITVTSGGTGYISPTISFTGGGGSVATANVSPAGVITGIAVTSGGTGYTSAPTVVISGGGGTGATATATVSPAGVITGITVTSGGTGYTSTPTISFTGGGGSVATATVSPAGVITGIVVNSGGAGYTSAPTVIITATAPVAANLVTFKTLNTALYNFVKSALKERFLTLPPSGAIAGIYAATDSNRGVWKAPANVSLTNVIEPVIKLDNDKQDNLNVDATTGKSINAIRAFMGKGTLVWGARTLAGNDNEWRYIPVRRFFSVVEESVKKSTYWAVFEPNDANTWVKVRGMIENYLTQKWREGALAGATPKEAFFVKCGLGITMTAIDILEGRMNVEIGMAVVRPAEFIILKFSHKLQTS